ncbi:MAG: TetR/AcrR family transcriptional repressor of nem operon [Arenicella sp.]|jgi:TetR/AcrR family transcriptional repressor of nem operon
MYQKHDKELVVKKGLELFCSKGYNNLGIDEICKSTGMTKGAFYNAFKSKEQFLLAAMTAFSEMTVKHLNKKLNHDKEPAVDRLIGMYQNMFAMQPKKQYVGCMVNSVMSELGLSNELVAKAADKEFQNFLDVIEPVVKEAQDDGDLTKDMNAKILTELLHSTFYGALTRAKTTKKNNNGAETMTLLIQSLKPK